MFIIGKKYKYTLILDEELENTLLELVSFYHLSIADTIRLCIISKYHGCCDSGRFNKKT